MPECPLVRRQRRRRYRPAAQPVNPQRMDIRLQIWAGLDEPQERLFGQYTAIGNVTRDPVTPQMIATGARDFTVLREHLCTDQQWYRSDYFNEIRRPVGIDDLLYTQVVPDGLGFSTAFGFCRPLDSRPFEKRDVSIVHFAHMELRRIWRNGDGTLSHLGKRQREVLELICEGYSEKEAAYRLSLSPKTVHNYVTLLHQKLNAHSRGELVRAGLKLFRTWGPRVMPDITKKPI